MSSQKAAPKTLAYSIKSFMGYLEGTEKAAHTIRSYRSDLESFQQFLEKGLGSAPTALDKVSLKDLERYHGWLKAQGLKTNTRRRKILTVRKLLKYLHKRNRLELDIGGKLPAPYKVERVPQVVPSHELLSRIRSLEIRNTLQLRNRALLWVLAETGCRVSEIAAMRFGSLVLRQGQAKWVVLGKFSREIPISADLFDEITKLKGDSSEDAAVFFGFNKFGPLKGAITSRGVELLVEAHRLRLKIEDLTPRTFRHSIVVHWYRQGIPRKEILDRLGLRTDYAFRAYEPLLKSSV